MQHLEQEKHELRRRLESREGEWEGRVADLETDVRQLQGELERQQVQLREAGRDKTKAISELSDQNHRLLEQLSRVRRSRCVYGSVWLKELISLDTQVLNAARTTFPCSVHVYAVCIHQWSGLGAIQPGSGLPDPGLADVI